MILDSTSILRRYAAIRRRTLAMAKCIPEDDLEKRPGPGRFSAGDLVRHIAASERWMWAENAQLRPSRYPGHGRELEIHHRGQLYQLLADFGVRTPPLYGLTEREVRARSADEPG